MYNVKAFNSFCLFKRLKQHFLTIYCEYNMDNFLYSCRNNKLSKLNNFYHEYFYLYVQSGLSKIFEESNLIGPNTLKDRQVIIEKLRLRNRGLNFYCMLAITIFHQWALMRIWLRVDFEEKRRLGFIKKIENDLKLNNIDISDDMSIKEYLYARSTSFLEYKEKKAQHFEKDFIDQEGYLPPPFTAELISLINRFNMSWDELMMFLSDTFLNHKWSPIFDILNQLNHEHSILLNRLTQYYKQSTKQEGEDKSNLNTEVNYPSSQQSQEYRIINNAIAQYGDRLLKQSSTETYFQRVNSLHIQMLNKINQISEYVGSSAALILQTTDRAYVSGVILWFQCKELCRQKIIVKDVIDNFFKILKKAYKNNKLYYVRQIFYDAIMGLQITILFVSEFDMSTEVDGVGDSKDEPKTISLNSNVVADLWREFCEFLPYSDKTTLTQSHQFNFNQFKNCYELCSYKLSLLNLNLKDYCLFAFGRAGFLDIDLPLIKPFSKGKIHAK